MALIDDLIRDSYRKAKGVCKVAATLSDLDGVEVDGENAGAVLREAIDNPRITSGAIARLLTRVGYPLAHSTVQRHRKQECPCSH